MSEEKERLALESVEKLMEEHEALHNEVQNLKGDYDMLSAELEEEKKQLVAFDKDLKRLEDEKKKKTQKLEDAKLDIKRIGHELERIQKDASAAQQTLLSIAEAHDWIEEQKEYDLMGSLDRLTRG